MYEYSKVFTEELEKLGLDHFYEDNFRYLRKSDYMPNYNNHYITRRVRFLGIPLWRKIVARVDSESRLDEPLKNSSLRCDGLEIRILDKRERDNLYKFIQSLEDRTKDNAMIINQT